MPFQTDNIFPSGGMDKDRDLSLVKKEDYLDALNIQHITDGGSTSYAIQNTKGNLYRFTIPATVGQNKIYRILLGVNTSGKNVHNEVVIYNSNGVSWGVVNWPQSVISIADDFSLFSAAFNAALLLINPIQTATITLSGDYAIVELTTVTSHEYSIVDNLPGTSGALVIELVQEAWSNNLIGDANIIGSYDLLGDLFIWSTPRTVLPSEFGTFASTADNGSGLIRVAVASTTGLTTGDSIVIQNAITDTNGEWIITVIDATHFDLENSAWSGTSSGIIMINIDGIGEIGVAVYDGNTDSFTYTTLIKSKEFKFTTKKQIDTYCEANNFRRSLYWTDDYNIPRVFYYSGAYVANGAISPIGNYSYGTIASETKLVLTNELLGFTFTQQIATGGTVLSGNWRYSIRLLTSSFSATNWTELSNPINVYLANPLSPLNMSGDNALVVTNKINEFEVTNLTTELFKYIELAAVNYVDGAISGSIVNRIAITGETMTIQHTGNETDVVNLDVGTLNQFSFDIQTAKNIDAIDNRLILSNLTTGLSIDFSEWTATWKHSIFQSAIDGVLLEHTNYRFGEYMDPQNVYNKMGYMLNETYRFAAKFVLKNGSKTNSFWIDDITIDDSMPTRRTTALNNFNLTDSGAVNVLVPYVRFEPQSFDYLIDGVPARDLISEIIIERVECVPEILFSGVAVMGVDYGPILPASNLGEYPQYGSGVGEYPYVVSAVNYAWPGGKSLYDTQPLLNRAYCAFYTPDWIYGESTLTYASGDTIINYGNGEYNTVVFAQLAAHGDTYDGAFMQYTGYFDAGIAKETKVVSAVAVCPESTTVGIGSNTFNKVLKDGFVTNYWSYMSSPVIETASLTSINALDDYGFYNIQYKRALTNKYGDISSSRYIPTGASLMVDATTDNTETVDVFGGDVFTQKTLLRTKIAISNATLGWQSAIGFYSQNRVNTQMTKRYGSGSSQWTYPNTSLDNWLQGALTFASPTYNRGYNIENGISLDVAFDDNLPDQSDLPTEIRWSDLKPQNSIVDNYRVFLPLNFKDLPLGPGEITHHTSINGELFTFQLRMVQRQYFNTRGTIDIGGGQSGNTEAIIGDGSVMARDGQMVTSIGTVHKWSVIKGRSAQGSDVVYWINTELKKVMRLGYDGSVSIADIHDMQSFFANNLKWVVGKDTPADGEGICGTWDDRYISAIWTVRGKRVIDGWSGNIAYEEGDVVWYVPEVFSTFEKTGEFYKALVHIPATTAGSDPTSQVYVLVSGSPDIIYVLQNFGVTNLIIGNALWNTDMDTTMADLVTSMNTNTDSDPSDTSGMKAATGFSTFDNSIGYAGSYNSSTNEFTLTPPVGINAGINSQSSYIYSWAGTVIVTTPSSGAYWFNGVDPTNNLPPEDNDSWELILHTDNNYYNEYTIEFNEQKNKWTTFYSFLPKIYLMWKDTFLTPRPISNTGSVFEHRLGGYCQWYDGQDVDGYIDMIYNQQMNTSKQYKALWFKSLIVPVNVNLFTNKHESFLLSADFDNNLDFFTAPIKNDILTSSTGLLNDEDTSQLFGAYVKVKLIFTNGVFQKLTDLVIKFFGQNRQPNR